MNKKSDNVLDLVYTVSETAEILKVNKNTIYDLIDSGVLKCIKLGNKKITTKSLTEFLDTYDGYDLSDLTDIKLLHQYQQPCGK
jgi:excisionase family DNA binding protein